jgi:galactokinase
MSSPRERARLAFEAAFGASPAHYVQAPGRVNLIGEHTDYNDGFVLPCPIDRHTMVAVGPAGDGLINVIGADVGESDKFAPTLPIAHAAAPWANYVRGVASELLRAGHILAPARLAIAGDVPLGAGLSSSASLEVAVARALAPGAEDPRNLALLCQRAENDFVGCSCGIMDQLVSAAGVRGEALLIDCRTLDTRSIALPGGATLIIVDSGVRHTHAGGEYNMRRAECERAARHYGVAALRDLDIATLDSMAAGLDAVAYRRARHVVTENTRVLAAADALAEGNFEALGALMAASHRSMRSDFEITVAPIDRIVAIADSVIAGRGGARMTGGGFGGSVVALVPQGLAASVVDAIRSEYRTPDGRAPEVTLFRGDA